MTTDQTLDQSPPTDDPTSAREGRAAVAYASLRKSQEEEPESMLWLITFTDTMALLLTFFVLLYAMSAPKEKEWQELSTGMSTEFQKFTAEEWQQGKQQTVSIEKLDFTRALNLNYLSSIITEIIARDERLGAIELIPQPDSLMISLPLDLLFEPGQTMLSAPGRQAIFALGAPLARIKNRIEVIGHADSQHAADPSKSWSLSMVRAAILSQSLASAGYKRDITVRGLSSSRLLDLPVQMPEAQKRALLQRVEIVIMKDDGKAQSILDLK